MKKKSAPIVGKVDKKSKERVRPAHLKVVLPARFEEVPPLREAVEKLLLECGVKKTVAFHGAVIVDELCNNAIEHGSKSASVITLELRVTPKKIEIACTDEGADTTVPRSILLQKLNADLNTTDKRGRGLKLVKGFTNQLSIEEQGGGLRIVTSITL